jgi:hypothetical protein
MKFGLWLFGILLTLTVTTFASAQTSIYGGLRGVVLDSQGLAIPGAAVQLQNQETAATLNAVTGSFGDYGFPRVNPGRYELIVEAAGFKRSVKGGLVIPVNETLVADVRLEVGQVSESVEVTSSAGIVESERVAIAGSIDQQRVQELPLNGKNFERLVSLAPGVAGLNVNLNSPANNNPSISGARPIANTFTVDGVSANDERNANGLALVGGGAAGFAGASPNLISTEAIQEFSIITSNADATFGRGSGGQINVITRSGSNSFHGSAYEYLRNNVMDARDFFNYGPFFDRQRRAIVPPFRQNLFGVSAGGPIVSNRHFFFANYEGFRQVLEQTASATVPNATLLNLIPGQAGTLYRLFYLNKGIVPASGVPAGASFSPLSATDRANAIRAGFDPALFNGSPSDMSQAGTLLLSTTNTRNVVQDSFSVRTDHRLTERLSTSFRYAFAQPTLEANTRAVAGVLQQNKRRWQSALAQAVYTLSPTQIFEFRAGLERSGQTDRPNDPVAPALVNFGVDRQLGLQSIVNSTALSIMQIVGSAGFLDNQTVPQFALQHTWTHGRITLRSGLDIRHLNLNLLQISNATFLQFGGLVGSTGLIGSAPGQAETVMSQASATNYGTNGGPTTPERGWRDTEQEYFSQMDWHPRPDVTLNLGLRYSYFGTYHEVGNFMGNLYAVNPSNGKVQDDVSSFAYGRFANVFLPVTNSRPFVHADPTNIQPRFGAAWDLGGRGRTVIRAGFGRYADRFTQRMYDQGVLNPPYAYSAVFTNLTFPQGARLPVTSSPSPQLRTVDPSLRDPKTNRFNFAVEQRLASNTSVTVAYVGLRASDLFRYAEPNGQGAWPQAVRPDQRFARVRYLDNAASSSYDSLQIFARHRYSHGVDFTLAYTYGRSLDDYSNDVGDTQFPSLINLDAKPGVGFQGGTHVAPRPILADKGYSDFNIRHSLVISHRVEFPFGQGRRFLNHGGRALDAVVGGYSLAGILTLQSGLPANVITGTDYSSIGDTTQSRPALLSGALDSVYAGGTYGATQWFVPQAQAQTSLGVPANVTDPFAPIKRNSLDGPPVRVYDLSLIKNFNLKESVRLRFEANAFNVFNHENFGSPVLLLSDVRFGRVVSSRPGTNPRQLQLGLKLTF